MYASQDQLVDRYSERMIIQLTDRAVPAAGAIDADVVERALADTDAQIDGYLAGRYNLPLSATPALVTDLALVIAVYKLHRKSPDEKIRRDYEDGLRALRDISAGVIKLNVDGAEPEGSGSSGVTVTDRERDVSPDTMKGFI